MEGFLFQASIYLAAAVIAVPIAARLGLGSVLGYLAAGILIGPVLGLVGSETKDLQHFAEFGVVMMLFLIGLELEPRALWDMRHKLLGLGGLQVTLSTAALMGIAMAYDQPWNVALAIGLTLALSSTAIVLQTLSEKNLMQTSGGRSVFSVLLTQETSRSFQSLRSCLCWQSQPSAGSCRMDQSRLVPTRLTKPIVPLIPTQAAVQRRQSRLFRNCLHGA